MPEIKAGKEGDILPGKLKVVVSDGTRIAVCNVNGKFFAIEDVCTHDAGSLDQGELDGKEVECIRHGARFDVTTGAATRMPAIVPVKTFPVRVEDGQVIVVAED